MRKGVDFEIGDLVSVISGGSSFDGVISGSGTDGRYVVEVQGASKTAKTVLTVAPKFIKIRGGV